MKLLYIIAPYSADSHIKVKQNITEAEVLAQYYWLKGNAVICPHLNTAFFSGLIPESQFYSGTLLMLSKCDQAIIHPRFKHSHGCIKEIKFCEERNIPITYIDRFQLQVIKNELKQALI